MGDVVSFINMKGGVGKTTLAVNIGYTLSKEFGKRVLLIDVDPQMNATQYTLNDSQVKEILKNYKKNTLYGILFEEYEMPDVVSTPSEHEEELTPVFPVSKNFDIIPSHLAMMSLDLDKKIFKVRTYINNNGFKNKYDVIILDLPPTVSTYTAIALLASDFYLVPMKTEFLSYFGLPLLENYIYHLKKDYGHSLQFLGIVLTMVRPDLRIYKDVKVELGTKREWSEKLFKSELKYRTEIEKALSPHEKEKNLPYIIELKNSELVRQMIDITTEFMQKLRL